MDERSISERVGILERNVETLETLPARLTAVELQIAQLRDGMREEFSATRAELRAEMRGFRDELRAEIRAANESLGAELRAEIRIGDETLGTTLRAEMRGVRDQLRAEIRAGDEETRRYMRVLHEEVLARIAAIQEGRRSRKKGS